MKIFDFTDGKKGELLGSLPIAQGTGPNIVVKDGMRYKVELADAKKGWTWHTNVYREQNITPEAFGVEAICMCLGEWFIQGQAGDPEAESEWTWVVVGTADWNRNACKTGILKAIKLGEV